MIPKKINSTARKGTRWRMSSPIGRPKTSFAVNIFNAIGGVISPISILTTVTTPNQIGSKPRLLIIGTRKGNVIIITLMESIKNPKIR